MIQKTLSLMLIIICSGCIGFPGRTALQGRYENSETNEFCDFNQNGEVHYSVKEEENGRFYSAMGYYNTDDESWIYISRPSAHAGTFELYQTNDRNRILCIRCGDKSKIELIKKR